MIAALIAFVGIISLTTALADMAMNGSGQARWAGYGLTIALLSFGALRVMGVA